MTRKIAMSDMGTAPKDGRDILIREADGRFAVVHWSGPTDLHSPPFGWTYDGGDRFEPVAWFPLEQIDGASRFEPTTADIRSIAIEVWQEDPKATISAMTSRMMERFNGAADADTLRRAVTELKESLE